jgi:hypothetical protein
MFRSVLFIFVLSTGLVFSKGVFKKYSIKSGMIFYDINITAYSNKFKSSTTGIARLIFDEWGAKELKEEDTTEIQVGNFQETHDHRFMSMVDNGTVYTVDFDDGIIYKMRDRSLDLSIAKGEDLSNENLELIKQKNGVKIGKDKVAGFECDVWKVDDKEVCLYEGLILSIIIKNSGFLNEKRAVQVILNQPIPPEQFKLPEYPVVTDNEYLSDESTRVRTQDMMASVQDLKDKLQEIGLEENGTVSPEQEKKIIDILGARYLSKQKRYLPKLLEETEKAKECIASANSGEDAQKCMDVVNSINEKLGDKTMNFDFSKFSQTKNMILDSLSTEINYLRATNDCVQSYNKASDVIICTEGSLGGDER